MKVKGILAICCSVCLTACGGRVPVPQLVEVAPPTVSVSDADVALPRWNLKTDYSEKFFEEAVDSMRFILLETTDASMLGVIDQVQKIGDKLVVVDAFKAQKILVFDMNGKFLHGIGAKGEGPGEYVSLNQVLITSEAICILDWLALKYIRYDLEGNVLYEHKFQKELPEAVIQWDEHTFIGSYAGYFLRNPYQLTWISDRDSILNTALPFRNPHSEPAGTLQYALSGSLLFYHNFCDTVYQISAADIIPKWRLGLYESDEVNKFLKQTCEMDDNKYSEKMYESDATIVNTFSLVESERYWIVKYQNGKFANLSVVNKKNGRSRNYIRIDMSEGKYYIPFHVQNASGDWLCSFIDDQFCNVLNGKEKERFFSKVKSEKDREMLRNYDIENQNPIVCLFHLK